MIYLKRYWKQLLVFVCATLIIVLSNFYFNDFNKVETSSEKKLSVTSKDNDKNSNEKKTLFVDVKGAVKTPGVYEIEEGKRIIDAINLAGGLSSEADTINLNLSKKVTDEMYIIVYTKTEIYNFKKNNNKPIEEITCASLECVCPDVKNDACISKDTVKEPVKNSNNDNTNINKKVSINSASKEELMTLTGIGETKANSIIEYRNKNGKFKTLDELKKVSGIGESTYEKIKNNITL